MIGKHPRVSCLLLLAAALALCAPVRNYPFVNYDDSEYVTKNHVRRPVNMLRHAKPIGRR